MPGVYTYFEPFYKQKTSVGIRPHGKDSASAQREADLNRAKPNSLQQSTEKESLFEKGSRDLDSARPPLRQKEKVSRQMLRLDSAWRPLRQKVNV
jgi:hypothetical protein